MDDRFSRYPHSNVHTNRYRYCYGYCYGNSDCDSRSECNTDSYCYGYRRSYSHSYRDVYLGPELHPTTDTNAKSYRPTKASANSAATSVADDKRWNAFSSTRWRQ